MRQHYSSRYQVAFEIAGRPLMRKVFNDITHTSRCKETADEIRNLKSKINMTHLKLSNANLATTMAYDFDMQSNIRSQSPKPRQENLP